MNVEPTRPTSADVVSNTWQETLRDSGYDHRCRTLLEYYQHARLGRAWRLILDNIDLPPNARVFELGCGGGVHLAKLAVRGYDAHGIDVSVEVVERARRFLAEVATFKPIRATAEVANLFHYDRPGAYDLTYHFGVVEHFLDEVDRMEIWRRLVSLTARSGWVASVVPCGAHIMRTRARTDRLCGYNVPEIDYTCALHESEFRRAGLTSIRTIPFNYFAFLAGHPAPLVAKLAYPFAFAAGNVLLPFVPVPATVKERLAHGLVVLGRREGRS